MRQRREEAERAERQEVQRQECGVVAKSKPKTQTQNRGKPRLRSIVSFADAIHIISATALMPLRVACYMPI